MNGVFRILGLLIIAAIIIVFIPAVFLFVITILAFILGIFLIALLTGVPIQIKEDGKVIGEIRFFKFHRK